MQLTIGHQTHLHLVQLSLFLFQYPTPLLFRDLCYTGAGAGRCTNLCSCCIVTDDVRDTRRRSTHTTINRQPPSYETSVSTSMTKQTAQTIFSQSPKCL